MCIELVHFGWTLLFMMPLAVEWSVSIGVSICGCPSSSRMFLILTALCKLMYWAPRSAYAADDMTSLLFWLC